jgi:CcmD family protein
MTYLFAAFTIVWLGLFAYLVILARRQKKLLDEIKTLKESIAREEIRPDVSVRDAPNDLSRSERNLK